jgi:hypothetical protein
MKIKNGDERLFFIFQKTNFSFSKYISISHKIGSA